MPSNIPKTSIVDEPADVTKEPYTLSKKKRSPKRTSYLLKIPKKSKSSPERSRKRQRSTESSPAMSIDSNISSTVSVASTLDSFSGFVTFKPVTVKTYMRVASDVETYRKLVEAGPEASSKVAMEFQRIFREYTNKINQLDWGSKILRERRKVEKRNRLKRKKKKCKHWRQLRHLRKREAELKLSAIVVSSDDDAMDTTVSRNSRLRVECPKGFFDSRESQRLESIDAAIEDAAGVPLQSKYRPITSSEEQVITETMGLSGRTIIQTQFGINMTVRLLNCLTPGVWLNDEVINFWLAMVQQRTNKRARSDKYPLKHKARVFIMNSFFWPRLYNNGVYTYKNVRRWTKKSKLKKMGVDSIFDLDKFLFPVHVNRTHWCAGVINFKQKRIEYYDSLGGCHDQFFKLCRKYLLDECRDKKVESFTLNGFEDYCPQDVPHQNNGSDCGVFALKFLEWACECRDPRNVGGFCQQHMRYFRRRTLLEIIQGNLLEE